MVSETDPFQGIRDLHHFVDCSVGLLVGLETYPAFDESTAAGQWIQGLQTAILVAFVVEIVLKIVACGKQPWKFFLAPWNLFDFFIVAVCLLPFNMQSVSVIRMARILRAVRMITVLPRLRLLVSALLRSIPSLGYIGVLLGLHFYIYAVLGTVMFRHNDPIRFGNLHVTATTLFQVLTLEGWNDVRDTQVMGSDLTYDDAWKDKTGEARVSEAQPLPATIYFTTFILLGTMIMLNLFTGVIISSIEEAQEERDSDDPSALRNAKERGFLTLHDELNLLTSQLQEISGQLAKLQQRSDIRELSKAASLQSPGTPASVPTEEAY